MLSITYASTAKKRFSDTELYTLLEKARDRNIASNITGLLLYDDGAFIQTFEGETNSVNSLYDSIKRDQRHFGIITLMETPIDNRAFPHWSMAFRNISKDADGHSKFLDADGDKEFWLSHTPAIQLLTAFRNRIR